MDLEYPGPFFFEKLDIWIFGMCEFNKNQCKSLYDIFCKNDTLF